MEDYFTYKKFRAGVIVILLFLSSSALISSANEIKTDIAPRVMINEGNIVTVSILEIEMRDYIDGSKYTFDENMKADFTWKIWVDDFNVDPKEGQGVENDWHITTSEGYTLVFNWDVGQKDEVKIKIELWDRDEFYDPTGDDICDINGDLIDDNDDDDTDRYVIFTYSLIDYNEKEYGFDGDKDGTQGFDDDDDDAFMRVKVSDNYEGPKPEIGVDKESIIWTGKKGDDYYENIKITNIGESGSTLRWEAFPAPGADDWGGWTISPNHGTLSSGFEVTVDLHLDSINDEIIETGYITIKSDRSDVDRVELSIIFTSHKNRAFYKTQIITDLLKSLKSICKLNSFSIFETMLLKPIYSEISIKPEF